MPSERFISVKEASERYGYSGSHIRNLLSKGVLEGEKFASVWMVDPKSLEEHQAQMAQMGNKKHGVWANDSGDNGDTPSKDRDDASKGLNLDDC